MVSINYAVREVCCKIVYYGPGLSGKTTNLQYVHTKVPSGSRGNLISLATEADRTLYFDFLPINIGTINGFAAKFQLYTVPGQVYYNATRKLVLRGVDGVVFVADSQPDKMDENLESLVNLQENLVEYGYDLNDLPIVIQYNKRDLPGVLSVNDLNLRLNAQGWPHFEASATIGNGVFDTLKLIIKLVLNKAKNLGSSSSKQAPAGETMEGASSPGPTTAPHQPQMAPTPAMSSPVPATPAFEAVAVASVATELDAIPSPAPSKSSVSRPFPGDRTGGVPAGVPVAEAVEPLKSEVPSGADPNQIEPSMPVPVSAPTTPTATNETPLVSPSMAPPLRRRPKRRGFFKRLFGIK